MFQGSFGSEFYECHGHVALEAAHRLQLRCQRKTKVSAGSWSSSQDSAFPRLLTHMSGEFLLTAYRRSQSPPPPWWPCLMMAWILVMQYPGYLRVCRSGEWGGQRPFLKCPSTGSHITTTSSSTHQFCSAFGERAFRGHWHIFNAFTITLAPCSSKTIECTTHSSFGQGQGAVTPRLSHLLVITNSCLGQKG